MAGVGLLARDLEDANGRADVYENCRLLIAQIDEHIREQNQAGYTHADTGVPQNLIVSGLSTRDAQTLVYSELLGIYSGDPDDPTAPGKGFRNVQLRIRPGPRGEEWEFHTEWNNMLSSEERQEKMAFIEQHTVRLPYTESTRQPARSRPTPVTTRGGNGGNGGNNDRYNER